MHKTTHWTKDSSSGNVQPRTSIAATRLAIAISWYKVRFLSFKLKVSQGLYMERAAKEAHRGADTRRQRKRRPPRRNPLDVFAGRRLKEARRIRGLTQTQVAAALGLSFQAVQKYETGENRISAGRLVQVSALLQLPLSFFAQDQQSAEIASDEVFTDDELKLVRAYRALSTDTMRAGVLRFIEGMRQNRKS
jgi:transcriptional regulator with XRE-family HTH domain